MSSSCNPGAGNVKIYQLAPFEGPGPSELRIQILKEASERPKRRGHPWTKKPLPNTAVWDYTEPNNVKQVPIALSRPSSQSSWSVSPGREQDTHLPLDSQLRADGQDNHELDPLALELDQILEEARHSGPKTISITQEQLVKEVKGIYAGLVMVEKKCVEIDLEQQQLKRKLSNEQWQALIALHRTLLHEHHDFFLASQHPAASPALRNLPYKYGLPERMWTHGVSHFLDLLRHHSPHEKAHMLSFVYLAYDMLAKLLNTVPEFGQYWQDCIEDLHRYKIFLENPSLWYTSELHTDAEPPESEPTNVRIQHHLAMLKYRHTRFSSGLFAPPDRDLWVLAGWYHLGRRFATSLKTYCTIFKILTLNILL